MKKSQLYFLSFLSGVLLSLAWPERGIPFLAFIAFIPLLWIEHEISNNKYYFKKLSFFGYTYIAMLIWNLISCWWIAYASWFGATAVIVLNSLVMALVLHIFHITKKILYKKSQGYIALIFLWITFEYLHQDWELAWPWLNLGYVFASHPAWIQWYEFTGFLGGSLWILSTNIILFNLIRGFVFQQVKKKTQFIRAIGLILVFMIPSTYSLIRFYTYKENINKRNIVLVQPNIDPYTEKYDKLDASEQLDIMLKLASEKVDSETDLIVFPETALVGGIWENNFEKNLLIKEVRNFLSNYPKLSIVIGASTFELYDTEAPTSTARKQEYSDKWYDAYNTALLIENNAAIQKYHKSQLVPGVEKVPFPQITKSLGDLSINLGGTVGTLGTQQEKTVFKTTENGMKIAPIICYESIFGEYLSEFVLNGANIITVITNDGWWKNSPGYRQHMQYARIRAIETRRSIARSANTGISCFINARGDIIEKTNWQEKAVIKNALNLNNDLTFYVRTGDFIGRIFSFFCALLLLYTASTSIIGKSKTGKL